MSAHIEFESRRFAVAFGVEAWSEITDFSKRQAFEGCSNGVRVFCSLSKERISYCVGKSGSQGQCVVFQDSEGYWNYARHRLFFSIQNAEIMARGLYCLGFEEEVLKQLPPLSSHEKLELRLSMPREFWPQRWVEEAVSQ